MKKIPVLLISIMLILCFTGCDLSSKDEVAGVEYYHYETKDFDRMADKLDKIATGQNSKQIIELYDKLYDECVEIDSLYGVIYIKYASNIANEFYTDEQLYTNEILTDCTDRLCSIMHKAVGGDSAKEIKKNIGSEAFEAFADYDPMTREEKKLVKREQKLVNKYYKALDESDSKGYKYKGKTWTADMLDSQEMSNLAMSDYNSYIKIYDGITGNANRAAGTIFLELVQIRDKLANMNGYDSYADFADENEYLRDYTEDDINQLHEDVKKISAKYYENFYSVSYIGVEEYGSSSFTMSDAELLDTLQKYSNKIDAMARDSADTLIEDELYNIGNSTSRQDGAFTTLIEKTDSPFISLTRSGEDDFAVLSHEFGHFVEFEENEPENILTDEDNIDLSEIASNGYQGLMTHYYDRIYKENGELETKKRVLDLLGNVVDGCAMDEFQREVYDNPDMSLQEINKCYSQIAVEYNMSEEGDPGYDWVYVSHNFEVPMYYISYAVSGLAAIQIWNQSQTDFDEAVDTWEEFIEIGCFNQDYLDVVNRCGLIKFTDEGAVKQICQPALQATELAL